jgi:[ribosomal protein S18]-alanine N-acetyltransferase
MKQSIINIISENYDLMKRFVTADRLESYVEKIQANAQIDPYFTAEKMVGFIAYYCNDPQRELAFLTMLCVDLKYSGQGIGKQLIANAILHLKKMKFKKFELEVKKENNIAKEFYYKIGFENKNETDQSLILQLQLDDEG